MARELSVVVTVESDEALRRLAALDTQANAVTKSVTRVGGAATSSSGQLEKLTKSVENTAQGTATLASGLGRASTFLTGFGVAMAVNVVAEFGAAILADADALTRLSDRTGIGTEALQRLKAIAEESGNSLEQVTTAVGMMQNRLAEGDRSAVSALNQLGLSLAMIKSLSPDEQFFTIARAVASITDPMERTRLAMDLFGRSGAAILPTLKADIDKIAASTVAMSENTVKALDRAGDAWGAFWRNTRAVAGESLGTVLQGIQAVIDRWQVMRALVSGEGPGLPTLPTRPVPVNRGLAPLPLPSPDEMRQFEQQSARIAERTKKTADEAAKAAEAYQRFVNSVRSLTTDAVGARPGFGSIGILPQEAIGRGEAFANVIEGLNEDGTLVSRTFLTFAERLQDVGLKAGTAQKAIDELRNSAKELTSPLVSAFKALPSVIVSSIGASGNPLKAAGSLLGSALGQTASAALGKVLKGASGIVGAVSGALTAALPVIGSLIGPIASFIGNKLFHVEERKVNDLRDAFQALNFGSLEEMNAAFQRVGLTVDRVLSARKVKDLEAAIDAFNRKLRFQQESWQAVQDIAQKYGLTLEELGPAFQRQALDQKAQELFKDFSLLIGAGADQDAVLQKMSKSLNEYIKKAVTLGVEVPDALRPVIQRMIELGLLTDASGKKVGSLEESGIKFSQTMTEGFKTVTDAILEMVDALRLFLGLSPRVTTPAAPSVPTTPPPENPDAPGPTYHQGGTVIPFPTAHTGLYVKRLRLQPDDVPLVAQVGEGIVSRAGMSRIGGPEGLRAINRDLVAGDRYPGRTPSGGRLPTRSGRDEVFRKETPSHPWITVDARGAYFNRTTASELARTIADHLTQNGPDQTRFKGALKVS